METMSLPNSLILLIFLLSISISMAVSPPPIKNKPTHTLANPLKPKKNITNTTTATTNAKIKLPKPLNSTMIKKKPPKSLNSTTTIINKVKLRNNTLLISSNSTMKLKSNKPKLAITTTPIISNSTIRSTKLGKLKSKPDPDPDRDRHRDRDPKDPAFSWVGEDIAKISTTSKVYIARANKEMARSFKPYVGHRYAPAIASATSCVVLVLPLGLLTLLFHKLRSYLSLQRGLILIQAYLAIYFATLAVTALATGLEPLRFFYAASPASYAATQAMQTVGYVLYLLIQLVDLVVVFSSSASPSPGDEAGGGRAALLGLAQILVGLAVGMHYYVAVFHRAVAGEPPRADWKVHGVYAICFLGICALARAERRKKAYSGAGADSGKRS